ncbi:NAD-dependent deacetylase hst3 [Diatrype stigma]|uniref:NAD-dependent deacetylase hst3 n=1 Tax=Diatrype stigma TaxID=117547 RepID=A0AAN9YMT9_9PEZI
MPTVQVTPTTSDLLQDVANALGKSRKVVVVTGAGISTNSGIPDFRSENGLYSLIQAQFERAAANPAQETTEATEATEDESNDFDISDRPIKRRRVSVDPVPSADAEESIRQEHRSPSHNNIDKTDHAPSSPKVEVAHTAARFCLRVDSNDVLLEGVDPLPSRSHLPEARPPFPRHLTQFSVQSSTSQDSVFSGPRSSTTSTQTEESVEASGKGLQDHPNASLTPKNRNQSGDTVVSSPLSSPPPILFDPYENHTQLTQESSQSNSECSDSSDTEDTQRSLDFLSSQTSNPSLRNMKGRDLFATSLRQKVREVQPTATHHFIAQLRDVGKLARVYTQNIDEIEKKIGLSTDLRNGAGNKRRKSAKQQALTGSDGDTKENIAQPKAEEDSSANGKADTSQPASQTPEDAERVKSRPGLTPDKGVECVFLHGSLHSLRCFVCGKLCDWDADNRESRTLSGEQPECPHCAGATAARQEKGKRALGVGKLRPDIVLYGEEHPESDLISPIVQYDLSAGPDLLLVLGTSLRVHGLKVMVKEFAKAVHQKGGKVVFINFTKPSESVWGDIIDYWIEWDCDAWVTDLKDRKPHLWLSPEEIQEQEKQKRETLAERRRGNLLKRESIGDKKRDSLLGEKRRQTIETSKPRAPPKNPSAMRNDYACGAYVVHDIFQSLAKIGDRPFDNLGYTPRQTIKPEPPPPSGNEAAPSPSREGKKTKAEEIGPSNIELSREFEIQIEI